MIKQNVILLPAKENQSFQFGYNSRFSSMWIFYRRLGKKKDTQIHSFTYFIIYSKIKRFVYHLVHQMIAVKVIIYTKSRILRLFSSLKSDYFKWEDMYSDFRKQISLLISSICGQKIPVWWSQLKYQEKVWNHKISNTCLYLKRLKPKSNLYKIYHR